MEGTVSSDSSATVGPRLGSRELGEAPQASSQPANSFLAAKETTNANEPFAKEQVLKTWNMTKHLNYIDGKKWIRMAPYESVWVPGGQNNTKQ